MEEGPRSREESEGESAAARSGKPTGKEGGDDPLRAAYGVLLEALRLLSGKEEGPRSVRDSDLKRKMLQLDSILRRGGSRLREIQPFPPAGPRPRDRGPGEE